MLRPSPTGVGAIGALGGDPAPATVGAGVLESVEVATHAWIEALLPGGDGGGEPRWVGVDPTNRQLVGEAHVKIGHGRHYNRRAPDEGASLRGRDLRARGARHDDPPRSRRRDLVNAARAD